MPLWDQTVETGARDLDEVHRELFDLLDLVLAATERGDLDRVRALLAGLRAETVDHFADEQGRLVERRDPLLAAHLEAHAAFLADLDLLGAELGRRGLSPLFRLWSSTRLVDWLRYHTRTLDRALASGAAPAAALAGGAWRPGDATA